MARSRLSRIPLKRDRLRADAETGLARRALVPPTTELGSETDLAAFEGVGVGLTASRGAGAGEWTEGGSNWQSSVVLSSWVTTLILAFGSSAASLGSDVTWGNASEAWTTASGLPHLAVTLAAASVAIV